MTDKSYYRVLDFLDKAVENNELSQDDLKQFKTQIRDNKYVSTYIRSLQEKMKPYKFLEDYLKEDDAKFLNTELEIIFNKLYMKTGGIDPFPAINTIISNALDREGKLCDFRDSINPNTKYGYCESDTHEDLEPPTDEKETLYLTLYSDEDTQIYDDDLYYICQACYDFRTDSDCGAEVSCDME